MTNQSPATVPAHLSAAESVPVPDPTVAVPVPHGDLSVGKWKVGRVGDRWGAFQPWVDGIYWLRLFDTFDAAAYFVRTATARANLDK